jgi:hypothetical protein
LVMIIKNLKKYFTFEVQVWTNRAVELCACHMLITPLRAERIYTYKVCVE